MAGCSNFVLEGLPTNGALARKLWLASKVLSKLPFSDEILGLTIPQLDWIVEMIAKDNPDKIRITRNGEDDLSDGERVSRSSAAIWDTKRGKAKTDAFRKLFNPQQLENLKKHKLKRSESKPRLYLSEGITLPSDLNS